MDQQAQGPAVLEGWRNDDGVRFILMAGTNGFFVRWSLDGSKGSYEPLSAAKRHKLLGDYVDADVKVTDSSLVVAQVGGVLEASGFISDTDRDADLDSALDAIL